MVEIGCGVGWHPIQYATSFPDRNVLAIERTAKKFRSFAQRIETHTELHNRLCGVHADAVSFIDETLTESMVDEVWILYPNPEPKKATKRWFQNPFMARLTETMKPGATLHFATNLPYYAQECRDRAAACGFSIEHDYVFNKMSAPGWKPRTHFEKKYLERADTLFDFKLRLKGSSND